VTVDKSKVLPAKFPNKLGLFLVVVALVVLLDQLSKFSVRTRLDVGELVPLVGRLSLTHVRNTGSAFGFFANQTFLLVIVGLACLLVILLFLRYLSPVTALNMVSIALIFSGAVGNLIDRLRFGYVTDFIDFRLWGGFHWPAFNFADIAITAGVFLLIYSFYRSGLFRKGYEHNQREPS